MKNGIHPEYHITKVACSGCGNEWETGSTAEELKLEICSKCHPYYTGEQKLVDTAGRVERFRKRYDKKLVDEASADEASTDEASAEEAPAEEAPADEASADEAPAEEAPAEEAK
mgnify:FL=1